MQQEITRIVIRNPFGTMDVPDPNGWDVGEFATKGTLTGSTDDVNASRWGSVAMPCDPLDGAWACRWNGGADPTIPDDSAEKWKSGRAEVRAVGDRVYLRFDWNEGRRHGLIDARREGTNRLVGRYINLTDPKITRPWLGLIVDAKRIDGQHPNGRLDFRR